MRLLTFVAIALTLGAAAGAQARQSVREVCDYRTPADTLVDCFSGAYHGTGFLPMEETISFRRVSAVALRASPLWRLWLAESLRVRSGKPCANRNAVAYIGTFSFYNGGTFVACSQSAPNLLNGFFRVHRTYRYVDGEGSATLTSGVLSGSAARDRVVELVFSDAGHGHYAQPEVVLGAGTR
jgi:hypothetical protein